MGNPLHDRIRAIIGKAFARGTPYHALVEIERLLEDAESPLDYEEYLVEEPSRGNA